MNICNIYIPPRTTFNNIELVHLYSQLPQPAIFCGDLNSHNSIWGSAYVVLKGRTIESFVNYLNLNIIINHSHLTNFSSHSGTYSFIDLTIVSPIIQNNFTWKTHSDNFSMIISHSVNRPVQRRPKW